MPPAPAMPAAGGRRTHRCSSMSRQRSSNGHSHRGTGASPRTPGPHRSSPGIPWNSGRCARRRSFVRDRGVQCRNKGADFRNMGAQFIFRKRGSDVPFECSMRVQRKGMYAGVGRSWPEPTYARDPRRSLKSVQRATRHATGVPRATWYAASARCTLHASCTMHISYGASMSHVAWCTLQGARNARRTPTSRRAMLYAALPAWTISPCSAPRWEWSAPSPPVRTPTPLLARTTRRVVRV
jgi:hypothetical protein